jgi:hypothetical protein
MSLTKVVVTPEVWLSMATHALTTEAEEVMGLLLGDIRVRDRAGSSTRPRELPHHSPLLCRVGRATASWLTYAEPSHRSGLTDAR